MGVVYAILCMMDGRVYVGSTDDFRARRSAHWSLLKSGHHENRRLQAAWDEYGENWFTITILEVVEDVSQLHKAELRHILALGAFDPAKGFNAHVPFPAKRIPPTP